MKVSEQCGIAASNGNKILRLIRRNITSKEKELITPLYIAIVRPHLEHCIRAWRPYCKKDIFLFLSLHTSLPLQHRLRQGSGTLQHTGSGRGVVHCQVVWTAELW